MVIRQLRTQKILRAFFSPISNIFASITVFLLIIVYVLYSIICAKDNLSTNEFIVIFTAFYTLLTYILISGSITTQRINTINWINDFLKIDELGKNLLLDPEENEITVLHDPDKFKNLKSVIVKLNRVASAAVHAIALEELFELHWDWYYYLFKKYGDLLVKESEKRANTFLKSEGQENSDMSREEKKRIWVYYLFLIEDEVDRYKMKRMGLSISSKTS